MLILRRRVGEVLLIGEDVAIEVLECGSWGVKLGIRAPQGVLILRKELRCRRGQCRRGERSIVSGTRTLGAKSFYFELTKGHPAPIRALRVSRSVGRGGP